MDNKKSPNDLDQVRELIFGEQTRQNQKKFDAVDNRLDELKNYISDVSDETGQRFKQAEKDAQKMQKELESHLEKVRKELSRSLESTKTQILKKIDQLIDEKTDRMQLGNFLIDMGMKIKGEDLMETLKKGAEQDK
jgi:DNA anti-recombination protein RmuC